MIEFLRTYYREIIELILVITSLVLLIVRKKPVKVVDSVKTLLIEALPSVINRVENYKDVFEPTRKLSGDEKLRMALHICESYLVDELGIPDGDLPLYTSWLVEHIEEILSTPQKKGI